MIYQPFYAALLLKNVSSFHVIKKQFYTQQKYSITFIPFHLFLFYIKKRLSLKRTIVHFIRIEEI